MKKKFLVSMLVVLSTIGLSACVANKDLTDEEEDDRDPKILEIFQLYQDNGGTLTYEEWLASIKGEKGDKGDQGEKGDKGDKGDPGKNGQDGKDGQDGTNGIDGKDGQDGVDGKDGDTPYIGENGNWWVGDVDTGVNATVGKDGHDGTDGIDGVDGKDGETPYIGENGNWWVGDVDTGVNATVGKDGTNGTDGKDGEDGKDGVDGKDGKDGDTPYIGDNGNWWIDGVDTGLFASNVQKFTITYHLNGGSLSLNESSSVQVNWGSTLNLPTPTKKGYTFAGWFIESSDVNNPTRQFYSIDRVFTDLNLYAHWTPATFTVYLDFDGGRYIDHETNTTYWWNHFVSVTTDQPYSLPVDILKDDCEFIGWYQGNVKWENTGIFNSGEDIYLTAKYNATEYYNITLDLDGGTCTSPTTIRVAKDGEYTLPTNVKKPGYEFLGWYAGNTLWNNSGTFTYGGNITLVAKYREMHTFKIQLNLNHGTYEGDTVIEVEYNAAYTLPHAGVTRDGKVFGGWYNGDVKWDFTGTFDLKEDIWLDAK